MQFFASLGILCVLKNMERKNEFGRKRLWNKKGRLGISGRPLVFNFSKFICLLDICSNHLLGKQRFGVRLQYRH